MHNISDILLQENAKTRKTNKYYIYGSINQTQHAQKRTPRFYYAPD